MGGGGKTVIEAPKPINVEESMRDYLEAITDPELVGKQLDAEKIFGPQFDMVSLARTQTMLEGIKDPKESAMYLQATARRAGLEAKKAAIEAGVPEDLPSADDVNVIVDKLFPKPKRRTGVRGRGGESKEAYAERLEDYERQREIVFNQYSQGIDVSTLDEINSELARADDEIARIENMPAQKGLLDMAEESAERMADLQVKVDRAKREGDIADLEDLGPGLVEALRKADPTSSLLAGGSAARAVRAQQRAMRGVPESEERIAMGELSQQGRDRIAELDAMAASARTPAESAELNKLKAIRGEQGSIYEEAAARAEDPTSIAERAALGDMAEESRDFASQLMQEAQNPALPNAERQRLIAMSQQQEERANSLYEQAQTISDQRQAAGSLAELSAQQARQLSADALGPLSAERRRMAEQAARQQGLRTGRIGDQMQLASELLNREEQRALLRAEAREAQDLAYRQAAGFATDVETDAQRLREEGRLTTGQAFDMGSEIQSDLDELTAQRRAQALMAQDEAFDATSGLMDIDQGLREEAQAALGAQAALTGQIYSAEQAAQQQAFQNAAALRAEAIAAEQAAFEREGQLAAMDESLRAQAMAEADMANRTAFSQSRELAAPSTEYLLGTSSGVGQGQGMVSQAPAISQSFGEMFNPERGYDIAAVNQQNMLRRNIAQANVDAQDRASKRGMIGDIVGSIIPG